MKKDSKLLKLANGNYVFRKRTPSVLMGVNAPSEIRINLYTTDYTVARNRVTALETTLKTTLRYIKDNNISDCSYVYTPTGDYMYDLITSIKIGGADITFKTSASQNDAVVDIVKKLTSNENKTTRVLPYQESNDTESDDPTASRLKNKTLVLHAWKEYCEGKNQNVKISTIETRVAFNDFINFLFHGLRFKDLTYDKSYEIREALPKLPSLLKHKEFYRCTDPSITKIHKGMTLISENRVQKLFKMILSFINWAVGEAYTMTNYFANFNVKKPETKKVMAFRASDLMAIFNPKTYMAFCKDRDADYWLPIIALYSGARLSEIAQLELKDVIKGRNNIYYFSFNTESHTRGMVKLIKNRHSIRIIPIHPEILKLGFLDYFDDIKRLGNLRLFPDIPVKSNGRINVTIFSSRFSHFRERYIPETRRSTFHSFRHTFITALMHSDKPLHLIQQFVGHAQNSITFDLYGEPVGADKLLDLLNYVQFPMLKIPRWRYARTPVDEVPLPDSSRYRGVKAYISGSHQK